MKIREVTSIISQHFSTSTSSSNYISLKHVPVDLPEIQSSDASVIPKHKAALGAQLSGGPCICEDTSLCIHALGGMPGPFIKFFQTSLGNNGLYKILEAYEDKSATAVCTLAFVPQVHGDPVVFQGVIEGRLVDPDDPDFHGSSSSQGFGWDSIFIPQGYDVPFSEMSLEEKCKISHRGEAVRQWASFMELNEEQLKEREKAGAMSTNSAPGLGHRGFNFMKDGKEIWEGPRGFQVK